MDRFMVSRRAQATDLVEALGAGDLEAARRLAHKLRGGLDMCGFASASALARGLEEALATGDAAGAPAQAASLRDYLGSVRWRARDAS
jgi:HPt (histidine-containing phosphotransfer) domain-containing protein